MSGANNSGIFNQYPAGTVPIPAGTVFLAAASNQPGALMYNYTADQMGIADGQYLLLTGGTLDSPGTLTVAGLALFSSEVTLDDGFVANANGTLNGDLILNGNGTINGDVELNGTLTVNGGPFVVEGNSTLDGDALINGNLTGGAGTLAWTGVLTVNSSGSALPTAATGSLIQVANAASTVARIEADSYAAAATFSAVRRNGTPASPSSLTTNDEIGGVDAWGLAIASLVGPAGSVHFFASENWSVGHRGTYLDLATTATASTTMTTRMRVENDGGVTVPPTVTGGSKGVGSLNAAGLYVGGVAVLSGVNPVATGGTGLSSGTSGGILGFTGTATLASSVLLTNHAIVLGRGAGATPVPLASLGTSTTVLHGAAAGDPTFGPVALASDVSGNLPVSNLNGGTSASASTFWRGDGTWAPPTSDIALGAIGAPLPASQQYPVTIREAGTLVASGAVGRCHTHPTSTMLLILAKEASGGSVTTIGTLSINTGGTITFPAFGTQAMVAGDTLYMTSQATADATGGDVSATWAFVRT